MRVTVGNRVRQDSGSTMVEFALLLSVLLLLVLGIINFGYVFGQQLSLNQAVREGARRAVVSNTTDYQLIDSFVQDATGGLISPKTAVAVGTDIQAELTPSGFGTFSDTGEKTCAMYNRFGGQLQVTAQYQATWLVRLPISIAAPGLKAKAVFRCEVIG